MAPEVSVLMPVRDGERHVAEAIDSITHQTFADLELIVVDDGSRDGTAELVAELARVDSRVRLLRQERAGIVMALERARGLARGRLIARMDADDIATPARIDLQVARLGEGDVSACGGQVEFFPRALVRDGMREYEEWLNSLTTPESAASDVYVECPIAHPALMVRRESLAAVGGWRTRAWPEDYDLVLRLHRHGLRFCNVGAPALRWRDHESRLSRTDGRYSIAAFVRCKAHHLREQFLGRNRSVVLHGAGPVGKSFCLELQRRGVEVEAFLDVDPRKIGKQIHGVPVHAVDSAPAFPRSVALGAVAGRAAREQVRATIRNSGRREGIDFIAVA
jgi:glycosyltransferase involved in cell wall biosynthesis